MDQPARVSLTVSVPRQTQRTDFGAVLRDSLSQAGRLGAAVAGAIPGAGLLSAAVSQLGALSTVGRSPGAAVASGPVAAGALAAPAGAASTGTGVGADLGGYVEQMRQEADRSMLLQLQMQEESREYNTLSNVLKVRHDSARAAINNLR